MIFLCVYHNNGTIKYFGYDSSFSIVGVNHSNTMLFFNSMIIPYVLNMLQFNQLQEKNKPLQTLYQTMSHNSE